MKIQVVLPLLMISCSLINASEVMVPAKQIETGKGSLLVYYGSFEKKLSFQVKSRDSIQAGNLSYFSESTNDYGAEGRENAVTAKFIMNPADGLYYWLKAGIGSYELDVPSMSVTNVLSGQEKGWIAGTGLRARLFPDTIVTPAIAAEAGITHSVYGLDVFKSGDDVPQTSHNQLELTEIQISAIISKQLKRWELYGGLKVLRTYAVLKDKAGMSSVAGNKDNAGIFAGIKFRVHPKESIVIEGNFAGETGVSAGWNIDF